MIAARPSGTAALRDRRHATDGTFLYGPAQPCKMGALLAHAGQPSRRGRRARSRSRYLRRRRERGRSLGHRGRARERGRVPAATPELALPATRQSRPPGATRHLGRAATRCARRPHVRARQPLPHPALLRPQAKRQAADGLGRALHALLAASGSPGRDVVRAARRGRKSDHLAPGARPACDGLGGRTRRRALRHLPSPLARPGSRRGLPPYPPDRVRGPARRSLPAGVLRGSGRGDEVARELREADRRRERLARATRAPALHTLEPRARAPRAAAAPRRAHASLLQPGRHVRIALGEVRRGARRDPDRLPRVAAHTALQRGDGAGRGALPAGARLAAAVLGTPARPGGPDRRAREARGRR